MDVILQREPFSTCMEDIMALLPMHSTEVMGEDEESSAPVSLHLPVYFELDRRGALCVITARFDGDLVGYLIAATSRSIHRDVLVCNEDMHYVKPEYRGKFIGVKLFKRLEKEMRAGGVKKIYVASRLWHRGNAILERNGFTPHEMIYSKVIQ